MCRNIWSFAVYGIFTVHTAALRSHCQCESANCASDTFHLFSDSSCSVFHRCQWFSSFAFASSCACACACCFCICFLFLHLHLQMGSRSLLVLLVLPRSSSVLPLHHEFCSSSLSIEIFMFGTLLSCSLQRICGAVGIQCPRLFVVGATLGWCSTGRWMNKCCSRRWPVSQCWSSTLPRSAGCHDAVNNLSSPSSRRIRNMDNGRTVAARMGRVEQVDCNDGARSQWCNCTKS